MELPRPRAGRLPLRRAADKRRLEEARVLHRVALQTELRSRSATGVFCALPLRLSEQLCLQSSKRAVLRFALTSLRRFLPSSLRCFEPKVGLVARRGIG